MKLKNLTMAIAMATLGVASFGVQAEEGTSFYGSVRVGVGYSDTDAPGTADDASNTEFRNFASRMGFKAETEVADGLTGFGHYEFGVDTDSADNGNGALSTRKAYVGLKGGFGRVLIGQNYHTFYNTAIGPTDLGWWNTMHGAGNLGTYMGRTGEALSYDTTMGNAGVAATAYQGDDTFGDGFELGGTFDAGPVKLGLAYHDTDAKEQVIGVSAAGEMGPASYALTYTDAKDVGNSVDVHLGFNKAYVTFGQADFDASNLKPTGVTLGYTFDVGKKTTIWAEVAKTDDDAGTDTTIVQTALKYDF